MSTSALELLGQGLPSPRWGSCNVPVSRGPRLPVDRSGSLQPLVTARSLLVLAARCLGDLPNRVLSLSTAVLQTVWLSRLHLQLSLHRKILGAHDVTLTILDRPRVMEYL